MQAAVAMAARRQLDAMSRAVAAWRAETTAARRYREQALSTHTVRVQRRLLQRSVLAWSREAADGRRRAAAARAVWAFRLKGRCWAAWHREAREGAALREAESAQAAMRRKRQRWELAVGWHARRARQRVWRVWRSRAAAWAEEVRCEVDFP